MAERYSGETKNGKRHGKGILYSGAKCKLQGEWLDGAMVWGQGSIEYEHPSGISVRDEGMFEKGSLQGRGKRIFLSGDNAGGCWEGNFMNGALNGACVLRDKQGRKKEENNFVNGVRNGKGVLYTGAESQLYGEWENGTMVSGQGSHETVTTDGVHVRDVGTFKASLLHGEGKRYLLSGSNQGSHFEGVFSRGKADGPCTFFHRDGSRYEADFVDGKLHGSQRVFDSNGRAMYDTVWQNGTEIGPKKKVSMDIGRTPPEQLAVIRYMSKRANIAGLIGAVWAAVPIIVTLATSSEGPSLPVNAMRMLIQSAVLIIVLFRGFVFTYYWLAAKFNLKHLAVSAAVIANKNTRSFLVTSSGPVVSVVGGNRGSGYLSLFITCLFISAFVGTYLQIKYAVLSLHLRIQLKTAKPNA